MTWLWFALATAICVASHDTILKKYLGDQSPWVMLAYPSLYSLPFCLVGLWGIPWPTLGPDFWWSFFLLMPINSLAMLMYVQAIRISPLSLVMPLLAFTPVFLILVGWLILGETLNSGGILGIVAIVVGSYFLNMERWREGLLKPFQAIFHDRGSRFMLLVSFIFAFGAALGKVTIQNSSPLFFAFAFFLVQNTFLLILFRLLGKLKLSQLWARPIPGVILGLLLVGHLVFHAWAISLSKAAYMIAVKRTNLVFSVILGRMFLGEGRLKQRLAAAVAMLCGVTIISVWGS